MGNVDLISKYSLNNHSKMNCLTVLTTSCSLLLSTQNVEGKPNPNTLLVETDEGSSKGKDYNNWIRLNTGSAAQFSDYKDQASDYFNHIGINTGSARQFSDYNDRASDYFNLSSDDKAADDYLGCSG